MWCSMKCHTPLLWMTATFLLTEKFCSLKNHRWSETLLFKMMSVRENILPGWSKPFWHREAALIYSPGAELQVRSFWIQYSTSTQTLLLPKGQILGPLCNAGLMLIPLHTVLFCFESIQMLFHLDFTWTPPIPPTTNNNSFPLWWNSPQYLPWCAVSLLPR